MTTAQITQIALDLPSKERQSLVEVLWESLESHPGPLPEWQREVIDERLQELDKNPEKGTPWEESLEKV